MERYKDLVRNQEILLSPGNKLQNLEQSLSHLQLKQLAHWLIEQAYRRRYYSPDTGRENQTPLLWFTT